MAEITGDGERTPGQLGKKITTVGAAALAISILMGLVGVGGPQLHNILVFGGLGVAVVGWVLWRIVKV